VVVVTAALVTTVLLEVEVAALAATAQAGKV
jgi:hypothetical protein